LDLLEGSCGVAWEYFESGGGVKQGKLGCCFDEAGVEVTLMAGFLYFYTLDLLA
jgi:hypothetical protein